MLKSSLLLRKIQTLQMYNSSILGIQNAKCSGYQFYMNIDIWANFQICIVVPLSKTVSLPIFHSLGKISLT